MDRAIPAASPPGPCTKSTPRPTACAMSPGDARCRMGRHDAIARSIGRRHRRYLHGRGDRGRARAIRQESADHAQGPEEGVMDVVMGVLAETGVPIGAAEVIIHG